MKIWVIVCLLTATVMTKPLQTASPPRVFTLDPVLLQTKRDRVARGELQEAMAELTHRADQEMERGPWSVMEKTATPSSDKHDYVSVGHFWWPNPETDDGTPFVWRDGHVNPDRLSLGDVNSFRKMKCAVTTLATAYSFSGNETYAERAAMLVTTWYLDPETRMNPHLNYAQMIPGKTTGPKARVRGNGIIDVAMQPRILDGIGMLQGSDGLGLLKTMRVSRGGSVNFYIGSGSRSTAL